MPTPPTPLAPAPCQRTPAAARGHSQRTDRNCRCRTTIIDLNRKKAAYERFGVESYWVVVPDRDKPELIVFELRDGRYQEAAHVPGDEPFTASRPFAVEVVPSRLVAGLPPA